MKIKQHSFYAKEVSNRIELFCRFPNRETAEQVAKALRENLEGYIPPVDEKTKERIKDDTPPTFPPDGYFITEDGVRIYFNIDVLGGGSGIIMNDTGEVDKEGTPIMEQDSGFHINGLWMGSEEHIPKELQIFRVYPSTPSQRFG